MTTEEITLMDGPREDLFIPYDFESKAQVSIKIKNLEKKIEQEKDPTKMMEMVKLVGKLTYAHDNFRTRKL